MRKLFLILLMIPAMNVFQSCNQTSPEDALMRSVINSNLLFGFASEPWQREFEQPSEKLTDPKTGASAPMKRKEIWEYKTANIEEAYKKVKDIGTNDDNSEMISASLPCMNMYCLLSTKNIKNWQSCTTAMHHPIKYWRCSSRSTVLMQLVFWQNT